ncbi:VOC family protein [Exiguobacterium flavidum]|uniref:VOC family protein n=1 Tax=Exiguobacterium flavidum TaxID=2184695 RepID=UPI000DF81CC9|nr:VOC family protein [Exiguobacterium flavidum]
MSSAAIPHLLLAGNGQKAVDYYQGVFGLKTISLLRYSDPGFEVEPGTEDLLLHAHLKSDDIELMVSDARPSDEVPVETFISLTLTIDELTEQKELYDKLAASGEVVMDLSDTFWGATYGAVRDPFGVTWNLNCQRVPMDELMESFKQQS